MFAKSSNYPDENDIVWFSFQHDGSNLNNFNMNNYIDEGAVGYDIFGLTEEPYSSFDTNNPYLFGNASMNFLFGSGDSFGIDFDYEHATINMGHNGIEQSIMAHIEPLWTLSITPSANPNPVPEPTTMLLLGTGLIGLVGLRRRKKK